MDQHEHEIGPGAAGQAGVESSFRRHLRAAMVLPVIALLLAATVLVGLVLYLQDLNRWVDRTDVVIGRANLLERLTADREAALRGYLLSRDPSFLDQFNAADVRISPVFDGIQELVANDEAQLALIRSARVEVIRCRHHAAQQVDRIREGQTAEDVVLHIPEGEAITRDIRARLQEFVGVEEGLRAHRVKRADAVTRYTLAGGMVLAVVLGVAVAFATRRQMSLVRRQYADALDEQLRAELSLREAGEKLQLAKDAARMGAWDWTIPTGELVWSERCKALFAVSGDEPMTYDRFRAAVHPDDRDRVDRAVADAIANRTDYDVEMRVPWPDGTVRWVASRGRAYYDDAGRAVRMTGMSLDISDRKRAEEALLEANELLKQADRRKDEFLAILSHELRNPLAPIRNSIHLLNHGAVSADRGRRALDVIARQVDHLTRLVEDLLEARRISLGKMRLRRRRMDLAEAVRETVEDIRPLFVKRQLSLELESPAGPCWVDGDPTRLSQVIANLLHNAAKFTDAGGHVRVVLEIDGGTARLRVADDGVGVAPGLLQTLFEPFVQGERTLDRSRGGLGLGLALVRGIVELHGGTAAVRSAGIGKGTEFAVALPTATAAVSSATAERAASRAGARRVLVVEDSEDAAESLRDVLEVEGGHEVRVAADGAAGLEAVKDFHPDVVLCDLGLPVVDGYEVARRLRRSGDAGGALLVALSGYASSDDVERCIQAGFHHHLAKPADVDALLRLISDPVEPPRGGGGALASITSTAGAAAH